eukprot:4902525-Prymnesium_polylepis.1
MPKPRQMSGVNSVVPCSRWSARAGLCRPMAAARGAWGGSPTVGRWGGSRHGYMRPHNAL